MGWGRTPLAGPLLKLLLDTHVFLWLVGHSPRLDARMRDAIEDTRNDVFLSIASVWETAIKVAKGSLDAPVQQFRELLADSDIEILPITIPHALAAGVLPRLHGDPFDRMLVAQARIEGMTLVTEDAALAEYGVVILGRP